MLFGDSSKLVADEAFADDVGSRFVSIIFHAFVEGIPLEETTN